MSLRNALSKLLPLIASAFLAIGAFATRVEAATYTVANTAELDARDHLLQPGDTLYLNSGVTYSMTMAPAAGQGPEPVVIIGNTTTPITVTGVTPASHVRFYGLSFTNGFTMPSNGKRVMVDRCIIGGSLDYQDADSCSVRNTTVAGPKLTVNRVAGSNSQANDDTLEACSFTGLLTTGTTPAVYSGIAAAGTYYGYVNRFVRRFNTLAITQTTGNAYAPMKHYRTAALLSYGNKITITSTASANNDEGELGCVYRDSSYNIVLKRDTVFVNNESAGFSSHALYSSSGMTGYETSNTGWAIDSCYFRVFRGDAIEFQARVTGLRFRYNVVRSRLGTAINLGNAYDGTTNEPYIHHNTFMGNQAVYFGEYNASGKPISNNVFWGTSNATCSNWTAVAGTSSTTPTSLSDSNFVYSTSADSARAFARGTCSSPRTGNWATQGNDTHSYWGDPGFADTSWASLNVAATNAIAISTRFTLGHAGARVSSDVPPAPSQFAAFMRSATAGLSFRLANDVDTTATVTGTYNGQAMPEWTRQPGTNEWGVTVFGLLPETSYDLAITISHALGDASIDTTVTTRATRWWECPVTGPLLYVSTTGSDAAAGTEAAPKATMNGAWDALKALPNRGRGGGIVLLAGSYHQTLVINEDDAPPADSLYHIIGVGAEVTGADTTFRAPSQLTWAAVGANGLYKTRYQGADSLGAVYIDGHRLHKRTMTELLNGAGGSGALAWTNNTYAYYSNGTDSLYVRFNGASPATGTTMRLCVLDYLISVLDPGVRIHNLTLSYAGGLLGNGIGVRLGTGGSAAYGASGCVVDSCNFSLLGREGVYSITAGEAANDSIVVANNTFFNVVDVFGYKMTKGRAEESVVGVHADGAGWTVANNTITGLAGGLAIGHVGAAADSALRFCDDTAILDNTISGVADDGIELDGSHGRNVLVLRNSIQNCNTGISLAPVYGGPHYILLNKTARTSYEGLGSGGLKFGTGDIGHSWGAGLIAHNSFCADSVVSGGAVFEAGNFHNRKFYNNIFTANSTSRPVDNGNPNTSYGCDFDYNLYWVYGGDGGLPIMNWGAWPDLLFEDVQAELGWEVNGVLANPQWRDTTAATSLSGRGGLDRGRAITGITGVLTSLRGTAPDIGATELERASAATRRRSWFSIWLHIIGKGR